jgi:hypothetical protein
MEVIVLPPHRVLDGDMQVPERVTPRHLNPAPDDRIGIHEDNEELVHQRARGARYSTGHPRLVLSQRATPLC